MTVGTFLQRLMERIVNWRSAADVRPNPVLHMFTQDVDAFVIPYGQRSEDPIAGRLEGKPDDLVKATLTLRSLADHAHGSEGPEEMIPDVVRTVVRHVLWRGYGAFLIRDLTTEERTHRRGVGQLDHNDILYQPIRALPYGWTFRTPLGILELFGRDDRWVRGRRPLRFYPRSRIWLVDVPRSLGGRWRFWWMLRRLQFFSRVFPEWSAEVVGEEQAQVQFDVIGYSRLKAAYHAVSAERWGWTVRDVSTTYQTEFFAVYRTVTFHHSLAVLREHVIAALNALLAKRLGLSVRAELQGVPASSHILSVRIRMESGDLSLLDALSQAGVT